MKLGYLGIGLLLVPVMAAAQGNGVNTAARPARVPATSTDSLVVQQIYFEALRKKTIEDQKVLPNCLPRL